MTDARPPISSDIEKPGRGLLGWLGRQVGHVRQAMKHDPTTPQAVFRSSQVEEHPLPDQPHIRLRRTTVDEVVVDPHYPDPKDAPSRPG